MRKILFLLVVLGVMPNLAVADQCTPWSHDNSGRFKIKSCAYDNHGSGYLHYGNTGRQTASICYKVTFRNGGKPQTGCHSYMAPGEETKSSCYNCKDGVLRWELTKYKVEQ